MSGLLFFVGESVFLEIQKKKKEWCLFSFFKKVCFISLQKYNHRITQKYLIIVDRYHTYSSSQILIRSQNHQSIKLKIRKSVL